MADPIKILRRRIDGGSLRKVAVELGVSAAYLSDIMRGHRSAGPKVLRALGLEREESVRVTYREAQK